MSMSSHNKLALNSMRTASNDRYRCPMPCLKINVVERPSANCRRFAVM